LAGSTRVGHRQMQKKGPKPEPFLTALGNNGGKGKLVPLSHDGSSGAHCTGWCNPAYGTLRVEWGRVVKSVRTEKVQIRPGSIPSPE